MSLNRKTLGVFGGSFDPIHLGHINLVVQLKELHQLDEVIFFPAFCSPHKNKDSPKAQPEQRLKMVKLAIHKIPGFSVHPFEIKKGGLSFTIDTLRMLKKDPLYSYYKLRLLLSEDSLATFAMWKDPEEILSLAPPIVGCRGSVQDLLQKIPKKFLQIFKKGITNTKIMEISSTDVRLRLKKGLYSGHLVPGKVLDYIYKNKLYL